MFELIQCKHALPLMLRNALAVQHKLYSVKRNCFADLTRTANADTKNPEAFATGFWFAAG